MDYLAQNMDLNNILITQYHELVGIPNRLPGPLIILYSFHSKSFRYLEHFVFSSQILVRLTDFLSLSRTFPQIRSIVVLIGPNWCLVIFFSKNLHWRAEFELIWSFLISNVSYLKNRMLLMAENPDIIETLTKHLPGLRIYQAKIFL